MSALRVYYLKSISLEQTTFDQSKLRKVQFFQNVTLVERRRMCFRGFLADFFVAELPQKRGCFNTQECTRFFADILSQVGPFQVPQHHEIIPLSILGSDQQNMEKILEDFKWAGYRLAHVLADGESTASHKRQWRCWRFPQGHCFFIAKTLSKRLCTRYCLTNMVCRRGG